MWHVWGTEKFPTRQWWENLKEMYNLEELVVGERITVKREFKKQDGKAWTGCTWLKVKAKCRLLQTT